MCEDLEPIEKEINPLETFYWPSSSRETRQYYLKSEVDKVIAAKDKEIAELKADNADLRDDKKSTDDTLDERNAELAKLQAIIDERDKTIEELQADYKEACDRLQTANLIKDEQMAKVAKQNQTISSLRCEIVDLERRVYAANRDARRTRY